MHMCRTARQFSSLFRYCETHPWSKQQLQACPSSYLWPSWLLQSQSQLQTGTRGLLSLWPSWLQCCQPRPQAAATDLLSLSLTHVDSGSQYHLQAAAAGLPSLSLTQLVISWPVPAPCNSYWSASFLSDPVGYIIGSPCSKQQLLVCPLCLWPSWLHGSQYQLQAAYTGLLSLPLTQSDTWYVANTSSKIEAVLACPPVISSVSVSI